MSHRPDIERIDAILQPWRRQIGDDFTGYRNHVLRMATYCLALRECTADEQHRIEIAACFHDIGLWSAKTLDYLEPSLGPAMDYLRAQGLAEWCDEVSLMITEHHKLKPYSNPRYPLVELFRQGDLVDFSLGVARFGLPVNLIRDVKRCYPNAGFHAGLARKGLAWFLRHPLNPAPMMKW